MSLFIKAYKGGEWGYQVVIASKEEWKIWVVKQKDSVLL